ncbi:MAG: hypothetical protein J5954_00440 [Prevotella sp.]|nr:hypothetical protein [Prevotella sp.]
MATVTSTTNCHHRSRLMTCVYPNVRVFDKPTKKAVYAQQTASIKEKGESNCPLYAIGHDALWPTD